MMLNQTVVLSILQQFRLPLSENEITEFSERLQCVIDAYARDTVFSSYQAAPSHIERNIEKLRRRLKHGASILDDESDNTAEAQAKRAVKRHLFAMGKLENPTKEDLLETAECARKRCELRIRASGKKHRGDEPLNRLVGDLAGLWIDYAREYPTVSQPTATSSTSPFQRFVESVFSLIDVPPQRRTQKAISRRIQNVLPSAGKLINLIDH